MNPTIEKFAREEIKRGLKALPVDWQNTFKRMYGRGTTAETPLEALTTPIDQIVDEMPAQQLDWALTQIENSAKKLHKEKATQWSQSTQQTTPTETKG